METQVLGFDRPNIKLAIEPKQDSKRQLLHFIERHAGKSGIVYCLSRKKTEEMAAFLEKNGVTALAYHAGMSKEARDANQNASPGIADRGSSCASTDAALRHARPRSQMA